MTDKEYNQLLKFVYFEGYADSYADAETLLETVSDEELDAILDEFYLDEAQAAWDTPEMIQKSREWSAKHLKPRSRAELAALKRIKSGVASSAKPEAPSSEKQVLGMKPKATPASDRPRREGIKNVQYAEDTNVIADYLFTEGFADSLDAAEVMAVNISESWADHILSNVE